MRRAADGGARPGAIVRLGVAVDRRRWHRRRRRHGARLPRRHGVVAAGDHPGASAPAPSLLVLVAAALVDAVEHRLPNRTRGPRRGARPGRPRAGWTADVGRSTLAGAAFVAVPLLVTHLVAPAGMGFGDVKAGARPRRRARSRRRPDRDVRPRARARRRRGVGPDPAGPIHPPRPGPRGRRRRRPRRRPACSAWRLDDRDRPTTSSGTPGHGPAGDRSGRTAEPRRASPPGPARRRRRPASSPAASPTPGTATRRGSSPACCSCVLSALGGVLLFTSSDERTEVLVAATDLDPGRALAAADLRIERVGGRRRRALDPGRRRRRRSSASTPTGRVPAGTMLSPAMFAAGVPLGPDEVVVGAVARSRRGAAVRCSRSARRSSCSTSRSPAPGDTGRRTAPRRSAPAPCGPSSRSPPASCGCRCGSTATSGSPCRVASAQDRLRVALIGGGG